MVADTRTQARRRDRWVDSIVIAVLVLALALGWVVKSVAESRVVAYEDGRIRLQYPAGWIKAQVQEPAVFQADDRLARPFRTSLILEQRPLPTSAARPLAAVQQSVTLDRSRNWTAYRVLKTEEAVSIGGYKAMHVAFAYVEATPNPFLETVPVVMRGDDYLVPIGEQVYVFTLTAAEENYGRSQRYLEDFIRSFQQ